MRGVGKGKSDVVGSDDGRRLHADGSGTEMSDASSSSSNTNNNKTCEIPLQAPSSPIEAPSFIPLAATEKQHRQTQSAKRAGAVAFCLVGHPRHFRHSPYTGLADSFRRNLLHAFAPEALNVVFAFPVLSGMHTKPEGGDINFTQPTLRHELGELIAALEYLGAMHVEFVEDACHDSSCSPRALNCTGFVLDQLMFQMSRWKRCDQVITAFEKRNKMVFDWVWRLRFDLIFNFPVPHMSLLHPDVVYVANWRPNQGWALSDFFFAVPRKFMAVLLNAVDLVRCEYAQDLEGQGANCRVFTGIECLLVGLLTRMHIAVDALPWHDGACVKSDFECPLSRWVLADARGVFS
jgi:hypothetical protein